MDPAWQTMLDGELRDFKPGEEPPSFYLWGSPGQGVFVYGEWRDGERWIVAERHRPGDNEDSIDIIMEFRVEEGS